MSGMEWVLRKYLLNLLANDSVVVVISGLTLVIYYVGVFTEVEVKPLVTGCYVLSSHSVPWKKTAFALRCITNSDP